ncbi:hypothetical protein DFJ73DRAFT_806836 [Zopfochytrium polystomum]|nr:hypothetical protein DFJ73DRAFT_806836 [Zopfochytrium polystomum]
MPLTFKHGASRHSSSASDISLIFCFCLGDPLQHHSSFVVSIVNENQEFCGLDAIIHGRLARNAKKGRLVATWDDSKNVAHFLDIAWTGWNTQYRD